MMVQIIAFISIILVLYGLLYYVRNDDEIVLLFALFNWAVGVRRYKLLSGGVFDYVRVNYERDLFTMNDDYALTAMSYILIGTIIFVVAYVLFSSKRHLARDNSQLYKLYLKINQGKILLGFIVFFMLTLALRSRVTHNAFGSGYLNLFQMGLGGFIVLLIQLLRVSDLKGVRRVAAYIGLAAAMIISFNTTARFVFLSWMISLVFIYLKDRSQGKKLLILMPVSMAAIIIFSIAGNLRDSESRNLPRLELVNLAIDRALNSVDLNMLDGFMMVLNVYPEHLDYHFGGEHLEILVRPIPRKFWPSKPVGGYHNKLGLNKEGSGTVGISQTLYGSFYGEGGLFGIILFSFIYARVIKWLYLSHKAYKSEFRFVLKGVIIASLLPLLRGGDLPGIYAFIGMAFWPLVLFSYGYKRFLNSKMSGNKL